MSKMIKGRGAQININNRFQKHSYVDDYFESDELNDSKTTYTAVFPKTILNAVPAQDVPMDFSMNPYQGCEHGCIYCYARVTHEYWGYGPGLDFEQKIMYKPEAADLLRKKFMSRPWKPAAVMLSGNTDCYQPAERKFGLTRQLLEVCLEFGNPVGVLTKNSLIERDLDVLIELNKKNLVRAAMSITSMEEDLRRKLEPRTSSVERKLKTISSLSEAGIPVSILIGPVIPGLNMHEIPAIIERCAAAGARSVSYTTLRLNGAIAELFQDWLSKNYPDRYNKVIHQVEEINGGVLGKRQGTGRVEVGGNHLKLIKQMIQVNRNKFMGDFTENPLNHDEFRRPGEQLKLL